MQVSGVAILVLHHVPAAYIIDKKEQFVKKLGKTWCYFTIFHAEFDLVEDEFVLEIVHFKNLLIWFCLVDNYVLFSLFSMLYVCPLLYD